ncbi:purine nucleoside phosphorylase [bacterium SM23_57]|nr:MAG: purine nucleoside phosphorylase [bacterium SM23_57]
MTLREQIKDTTRFIGDHVTFSGKIGIILGTGLGGLAEDIDADTIIPYDQIPHFPVSTVEFHAGKLIFGQLAGKPVMAMQGRFHRYEGYDFKEITFPVRVMKAMGIDTLLVSNASGALNPLYRAGDLMIMDDHINLLGGNPLIGENDDSLGSRFPDMSQPYSRRLIAMAEEVALGNKIKVHRGVYAAVPGPNLETRAEYRYLRIIGADVVGMSTIPEDIVAIHSGMEVLGISVITDEGFPECLEPANIEKIIQTANEAEPKLTSIMSGVIAKL